MATSSVGSAKSSDLIAAFDPGASLTKVLYQLSSDDRPRLLVMEPDLIQLPRTSVELHSSTRVGVAKPEDDAWVECTVGDEAEDEVQLVGFLARKFQAIQRLDKLKYETALYKLLAAVGAIAERHSQQLGNRFTLALSVLLPYGEYQNKAQLEVQLKQALKNFKFRNQRLRVKLVNFKCFPEGAGLAMARQFQQGLDWFQRQVLVVLMCGHRNTSLLMFERGRMSTGHTTHLGFHQLVAQVCERTSGQDPIQLSEAIYKLKSEVRAESPIIRGLVRSERADNAEVEVQQLVQAISSARVEYWRRLQEWLNSQLSFNITEVVLAGGASLYLHSQLKDYFCGTPMYWGADLLEQIEESLQLNYRSQFANADVLAFRLVDAYGAYLQLKHAASKVAA